MLSCKDIIPERLTSRQAVSVSLKFGLELNAHLQGRSTQHLGAHKQDILDELDEVPRLDPYIVLCRVQDSLIAEDGHCDEGYVCNRQTLLETSVMVEQ